MSRLGRVLFVMLLVLTGCDAGPGDEQAGPTTPVSGTESAAGSENSAEPADAHGIDCSGTEEAEFPDVVDVELETAGDGEFEVSATLCSAYDTPERYADAWRVRTPDGEVLGVRELLHDHASEQPFTRSLSEPIEVPRGVDTLVVEGRDLDHGWGGATVAVEVPDAG